MSGVHPGILCAAAMAAAQAAAAAAPAAAPPPQPLHGGLALRLAVPPRATLTAVGQQRASALQTQAPALGTCHAPLHAVFLQPGGRGTAGYDRKSRKSSFWPALPSFLSVTGALQWPLGELRVAAWLSVPPIRVFKASQCSASRQVRAGPLPHQRNYMRCEIA